MKEINTKEFDKKTRPQDDFFQYVNGPWRKKVDIPLTMSRWGAFIELRLESQNRLRTIIESLAKRKPDSNSEERKIVDLYTTTLNMPKRTRQGLKYFQEVLDKVELLEHRDEFTEVLAYLHKRGVNAPWSLYLEEDAKKSSRMTLHIGQAGLGVPSCEYHVKKDKESKRVRDAYIVYMRRILGLEGFYPKKRIEGVVKNILSVEMKLAHASKKPDQMRDPIVLYNKFTQAQLQKKFRSINWKLYFDLLDVPKSARNHVILDVPKFVAEADKILKTESLGKIKQYLRFHTLDDFAGSLGKEYVDAQFAYSGQAIQGLKKQQEMWKRGVRVVDSIMGDALGKLYVEKYFPAEAKAEITALVRNLIVAYRKRIKTLEWMSEATKKKALRKLKTTQLLLGYPDKWESYKNLEISSESHVQNMLNASLFDHAQAMKKLAKPTDKKAWHCSAPTVNAFYNPLLNQIFFPAGILQPPFFYPGGDMAVNYGAIGMVIGHELTHGFDDSGSKFDEFGNLKNWWTKSDSSQFKKRTKVLVDQFNGFEVVDGIKVNGKLTLGENIADLGGLIIAYKAFKHAEERSSKKLGLTSDQRFFVGYALTEREKSRPEFLKLVTLTDPHSPSEFRVNGPLAHMEEFYNAFDVKETDQLYRKEKDRAKIW